jgi:hypothetical protein
MIASAMMIQNQGTPPSVGTGAGGEAGAAGGEAWARISVIAQSDIIVDAPSLLSIMVPYGRMSYRTTSATNPRSLEHVSREVLILKTFIHHTVTPVLHPLGGTLRAGAAMLECLCRQQH